MVFKVGDKVKVKYGMSYCSRICNGKILNVMKIHVGDVATLSCGHLSGVYFHELELLKKKELLTEVDYLNAFQENFKEGV